MRGNNKLFSIVLFSLLGVSALLSVLFFSGTISEGTILGWCYTLFGIAAVVSIVFPILVMAKNPKKAKTALFGIVGLLVVFGIGYAMASGETHTVGEEIGESVSKRSEAGLIAFYILILGAIGAIIYSEVAKAFK